jgi:hypothetical protein
LGKSENVGALVKPHFPEGDTIMTSGWTGREIGWGCLNFLTEELLELGNQQRRGKHYTGLAKQAALTLLGNSEKKEFTAESNIRATGCSTNPELRVPEFRFQSLPPPQLDRNC